MRERRLHKDMKALLMVKGIDPRNWKYLENNERIVKVVHVKSGKTMVMFR